jgi:hypothetical protein
VFWLLEEGVVFIVSSNKILMEGDTSSSYWPLLTDQINAKRKPDATIRLATIRIRITLTALIFPKVLGGK